MKTIKKTLKSISVILFAVVVIFISFAVYLGIIHRQPLLLPTPTGPNSIGRTEFDWIADNRIDQLSDTPNEKRELLIWIWYPANAAQQRSTVP